MNKEQVLQALKSNTANRTGARLSVKKTYTVLLTGDITVRLPNQAQALLAIMFSDEQQSWTEVELNKLINAHAEISEKQEPWIVFKFYRQRLVDAGFLSVTE